MDKGWSIDPKDWGALDQVLPRSGTWRYVLLTPSDEPMVPETPGIYAICAPPPNATGPNKNTMFHSLATPIYIGRSASNIKSRFRTHCRTPEPQLLKAKICYGNVELRFWFIALSVDTVKEAEARLIKCFGPPVNKIAGTITGTFQPPIRA